MSAKRPDKAFILAAGFGSRLRPYTDHCPKPMVMVNGRSLIDRTLDKLRVAGVRDVVVNLHYMADVLRAHLTDYAAQYNGQINIIFSYEDPILDTGGGVKAALHHFGGEPFFVIAGDGLWTDADESAFEILAREWDESKMDILTLMQPVAQMRWTKGVGDFDIASDGRAVRSLDKTGAYMWTNIRLNHPRIYKNSGEGAFSFLPIMDACQAKGRLFALPHQGEWHHISTPADLERVNEEFSKNGW